MSIETSIIYTTSDDKQFNSRQEAETHEQWLADGFDSDREGTAADVRGYLSQWTGDNR